MSKLYVGNLPFSTDEHTLRLLFSEGGREVRRVSLVIDRDTGRARGFAFVEMATEIEAEAAIAALDGREVGGRTLRVNAARERGSRPEQRPAEAAQRPRPEPRPSEAARRPRPESPERSWDRAPASAFAPDESRSHKPDAARRERNRRERERRREKRDDSDD